MPDFASASVYFAEGYASADPPKVSPDVDNFAFRELRPSKGDDSFEDGEHGHAGTPARVRFSSKMRASPHGLQRARGAYG